MGNNAIVLENSGLVYLVLIPVILIGTFLILKLLEKARNIMRRQRMRGLSRAEVEKRWKEIEMLMKQSSINGYKLAILEADKLLDHTMKSLMYSGENMGQRLKFACHKYPDLQPVWRAHIMRNKIAHDVNYRVTRKNSVDAIKEFKKALIRLGAL